MVSEEMKRYIDLCKERKAVFYRTADERMEVDGRREEVGKMLVVELEARGGEVSSFKNSLNVGLLNDIRIRDDGLRKAKQDLVNILRPVFVNCRSSTTKTLVDSKKIRLVQPLNFSQYDFKCSDIVIGKFGIGVRKKKQSNALSEIDDFVFVVAHLSMVIEGLKKKYPQLVSSLDDILPDIEWFGRFPKWRGCIVRPSQSFHFVDGKGDDRLGCSMFVYMNEICVFSYEKVDGVFKYALSQAYPNGVNQYLVFSQLNKESILSELNYMKRWFVRGANGLTEIDLSIERVKEKLKRWLVLSSL
jgi:hypothetical protein